MARTTVKDLEARLAQLEAQVTEMQRTQSQQRTHYVLVIDGVQRYGSLDYRYLSDIAKQHKTRYPQRSVQVHSVH